MGLVLGVLVMVLLQQGWNMRRRNEYVAVKYEWPRLRRFAACYLCYMVVLLWPRHLSLEGEILFSLVTAIPLPMVLYGLLDSTEREIVRSLTKRATSRDRDAVAIEL